jgi:hypothetical protein
MAIASGQRQHAPESAKIQPLNGPPLRSRPAWALLEQHYQKLKRVHLRQLFADDRERGERLAIEVVRKDASLASVASSSARAEHRSSMEG